MNPSGAVLQGSQAVQSFKIIPRAKQINGQMEHPVPVVLTIENLERHFSFPLCVAAKQLGVCETSLKWCETFFFSLHKSRY
jgi:hypothetical protein